eukprot:TRINITY_DN3145_c2_g1_i1.p1 TRINITY_DN3145_c2_g1~~TRINITY_DN3145_c2_g1_i1.p1  ORF type:complete len:219 (+),score=42.97 TRINITY_DN3145_c2_g1_i1:69-725(+)
MATSFMYPQQVMAPGQWQMAYQVPVGGQVLYYVLPMVAQQQQQQQHVAVQVKEVKEDKGIDAAVAEQQGKASAPSCKHNSWDNVRVGKSNKLMTLRCRECQSQWRAPVDSVWDHLRCEYFNTENSCPNGEKCTKIHLHSRKEGLRQRVDRFGTSMFKTSKATRPEVAAIIEQYEKKHGTGPLPAEERESRGVRDRRQKHDQHLDELMAIRLVENVLSE